MRFVRIETLAGQLRGDVIAERLGVPSTRRYEGSESGEWVVFVKSFEGCREAKAAGSFVAYDPVDMYCYGDFTHPPLDAVDVVIIPSKPASKFYRQLFPRADFAVIPHQWDSRIVGTAPTDQFKAGYVGKKFNFREEIPEAIVARVHQDDEQLAALQRFNCHVSSKQNMRSMALKPATKVSSAAAVMANIVTFRDPSALHLLPAEYPFYTDGTILDGVFKAKKAFGTPLWEEGLQMMDAVREKSSLDAVCRLYEVFR